MAVVETANQNKLKGNVEDIFPQIYRAQRPAVAPANISLSSGEVMEGGSSMAPTYCKAVSEPFREIAIDKDQHKPLYFRQAL